MAEEARCGYSGKRGKPRTNIVPEVKSEGIEVKKPAMVVSVYNKSNVISDIEDAISKLGNISESCFLENTDEHSDYSIAARTILSAKNRLETAKGYINKK